MLINHRKRSSYELMFHHVFVSHSIAQTNQLYLILTFLQVLSCFTLSIATRYYLAFSIISLIVEVNSIFLHWRQLHVICRTSKLTPAYRYVCLLNLLTFVIFRIGILSWMTRWMALNSAIVSPAPYTLGCVSIAGLMLMSIVLFFRLLRADYTQIRGSSGSSTLNGFNNNSTKKHE